MIRRPATAGLLLLALAACSSPGDRLEKPRRSALWVPAGAEVGAAELAQLERAGIGELFVEAGRLSWEGGTPRLEEEDLFTLPRRTGVTLVVQGSWPAGDLDPEAAAPALAAALAAARPRAEARGLVPLGFHLDLAAGEALESYGATLAALQEHLEKPLYLSATLERAWLGRPGVEEVAEAVDFLVPFVYGQRPGHPEEEGAWDLERVEARLHRLGDLGRDYLAGVVTVGLLQHLGEDGRPKAETTRAHLGELVRHPGLELVHGFLLEGVDHQVYRFQARGAVRVGGWTLAKRESVRVSALASYHVEELQRHLGALGLEHHLGEIYYRLAAPEEGLSLTLANLLNALSPEAATAAPRVELARAGQEAVRVAVVNASSEPTDVALLGSNFVELRLTQGGSFGRVEPGGFARYELLRPRADGELERSFRGATVLRLYAPFLAPGQRLESGRVEVVGGGSVLAAGGEFMVPGGRTVEVVEGAEKRAETGG